jgi:hypothetical protein
MRYAKCDRVNTSVEMPAPRSSAGQASEKHSGPVSKRAARWVRENALSLVVLLLFLATLVGQSVSGWYVFNAEQRDHGQAALGFFHYLTTGHFLESVFENWESEFFQMGLYVLLTVWLRQKGSAESKQLEGEEDVDRDPREKAGDPAAPWPVRRGGLVLKLYENSLVLAFAVLFIAAFVLHAVTGLAAYNQEQVEHGGEPLTLLGYLTNAQFWFESLQNWQSEFLAVAAIVVLTIFLRQRGSPQSKPVAAPHSETGK